MRDRDILNNVPSLSGGGRCTVVEECGARAGAAQSKRIAADQSIHYSVIAVMCHAVVLGVLFSLPSYLYSAVPFR